MWIHEGRLPHVLSPRAYFEPAQHDAELDALFRPGWHFAALSSELSREGSQRAFDLFGTPVLVRRAGGELRAFVNVCAHRHSQIVAEGTSVAPSIVCPYHGFRYREDGRLGHVPDAASFAPATGTAPLSGLSSLPLATAGELVFVSLAPHPPSLVASLDDETRAMVNRAFTSEHVLAQRYSFETNANWKIPLENVLENYHVPLLHQSFLARHPELFRLFSGTPDGKPVHRLGPASTSYFDTMGARSRAYLRIAEVLRPGAHAEYEHLHAFPNLVLADTHLVSFVQTVTPLAPDRSRVDAHLLVHRGRARRLGLLGSLLRAAAGRFMGSVLAEDASIYSRVQKGIRASPHAGVLSAREERVHAFQCHVRARAGDVGRP